MGLVKTGRRGNSSARRGDGEKAVRGVLSFWYTLTVLSMVGEALRMTFFG